VLCIYLRTNSDLCHLHHKLIGFYNRDEKCLQRGTDWVFKYSGLRFVFKGLIQPTSILCPIQHYTLIYAEVFYADSFLMFPRQNLEAFLVSSCVPRAQPIYPSLIYFLSLQRGTNWVFK